MSELNFLTDQELSTVVGGLHERGVEYPGNASFGRHVALQARSIGRPGDNEDL